MKRFPTTPTSSFSLTNLFNINNINNNIVLETVLEVVGVVGKAHQSSFQQFPTEKIIQASDSQEFKPLVGCWKRKVPFSYLYRVYLWGQLRLKKRPKEIWIGLPITEASQSYFFEDGSPIYGRIFWIMIENRLKHRFFSSKMDENHLKSMIKKGIIFCPKITNQ